MHKQSGSSKPSYNEAGAGREELDECCSSQDSSPFPFMFFILNLLGLLFLRIASTQCRLSWCDAVMNGRQKVKGETLVHVTCTCTTFARLLLSTPLSNNSAAESLQSVDWSAQNIIATARMASHTGATLQPARKRTIVSVDFGTYGSGFAFATSRPAEGFPAVRLHERYPGMSSEIKYPKTRSAVLYKGRWVLHCHCSWHAWHPASARATAMLSRARHCA